LRGTLGISRYARSPSDCGRLAAFDAKPPNADLPCGNGLFDWQLLRGLTFKSPSWSQEGSTVVNVGTAIAISRPAGAEDPLELIRLWISGSRKDPGFCCRRAGSGELGIEDFEAMTIQQTLNSFRTGPDETGHFRQSGGRFVAETLMPLILYSRRPYGMRKPIRHLTPNEKFSTRIMSAARARSISPNVSLNMLVAQKSDSKRDELNHTGAHKINNVLGQILLARRMGKTRIIGRNRRRSAWCCNGNTRLRALRFEMYRLYGRGRCRTAKAECLPHERSVQKSYRLSPAQRPSKTR